MRWKKRRRTPVFKKMSRPWEWYEVAVLVLGAWFSAACLAGPQYVDASLEALALAWLLVRVVVHRALGTASGPRGRNERASLFSAAPRRVAGSSFGG